MASNQDEKLKQVTNAVNRRRTCPDEVTVLEFVKNLLKKVKGKKVVVFRLNADNSIDFITLQLEGCGWVHTTEAFGGAALELLWVNLVMDSAPRWGRADYEWIFFIKNEKIHSFFQPIWQ